MARTTVSFDSAGIEIAAHLYLPDTPAGAPLPALVVGHPG
ncbi:alpha/beta hydrolase, partial [Streptomyces sp. NPDC047841]